MNREICTITNVLCEYKIIKTVFRYTREIIEGQESKFINIKNKRYFNFHGKYCTIDNQTCKFFYEIFVKKSFVTPKHQRFYQLEFNIGKDMWKHIYHKNIKVAIDRNITEFNYKLMHNLLSCRKNLFN